MIAARAKKFSVDYTQGATLWEWGAWRSWRISKGLSVRFMDQQGYYMVPTQWPHQFDADAHKHTDDMAGRNFFDALILAQRADADDKDSERRAALVSKYLKTRPIPRDPLKPKAPRKPTIDTDQLMADYEKDKAEQDRRDEERRKREGR
jgi:hypothetical protein